MQQQVTKLHELGLPRYAELNPRLARLALRKLHDRCRSTAPETDVRNIMIGDLGSPLSVRLYSPLCELRPPLVIFLHGAGG